MNSVARDSVTAKTKTPTTGSTRDPAFESEKERESIPKVSSHGLG